MRAVGIFFRMMHDAVRVFGRRINSEESKGFRPRILEIVPGASRNESQVVRADGFRLFAYNRFPFSRNEHENLVGVAMHLPTDFSTGRNTHEHELTILPRFQNSAEISILLRVFNDVLVENHASIIYDRTHSGVFQ